MGKRFKEHESLFQIGKDPSTMCATASRHRIGPQKGRDAEDGVGILVFCWEDDAMWYVVKERWLATPLSKVGLVLKWLGIPPNYSNLGHAIGSTLQVGPTVSTPPKVPPPPEIAGVTLISGGKGVFP